MLNNQFWLHWRRFQQQQQKTNLSVQALIDLFFKCKTENLYWKLTKTKFKRKYYHRALYIHPEQLNDRRASNWELYGLKHTHPTVFSLSYPLDQIDLIWNVLQYWKLSCDAF